MGFHGLLMGFHWFLVGFHVFLMGRGANVILPGAFKKNGTSTPLCGNFDGKMIILMKAEKKIRVEHGLTNRNRGQPIKCSQDCLTV